ncbi:hypothetical protein ACSBR2_025824 [Camellia fascicularis]
MGNTSELHHLSNLICDCRCLMEQLGVMEIKHTFRGGNACVDLLANEVSKLDVGFVVYLSMPLCIANQVSDDARGISYPRLLLNSF